MPCRSSSRRTARRKSWRPPCAKSSATRRCGGDRSRLFQKSMPSCRPATSRRACGRPTSCWRHCGRHGDRISARLRPGRNTPTLQSWALKKIGRSASSIYLKIEIQMDVAWRVEILNDTVAAEIAALPADMQARFLRLSERIGQAGLESLGEPHVKHLVGKLWELRLTGRDGIARAL